MELTEFQIEELLNAVKNDFEESRNLQPTVEITMSLTVSELILVADFCKRNNILVKN